MTRIDLHSHSTASDGTLTPAELVIAGAQARLDVLAITDHDTTGGWAEAAAARPPRLRLVRGAELSCRWYGVQPPIALHLLAYLFDPAEPRLAADLARVRAERERRAERIVELLRADGVDVSWPEVHAYAQGGSVGRPHIAQALIRAGLVRTMREAFAPALAGRPLARSEGRSRRVRGASGPVRAAGGVPVFAHPRATAPGPDRAGPADRRAGRRGAAGLEADHEDHTPRERAQVRALADELGLVATGSSDFHGTQQDRRAGRDSSPRPRRTRRSSRPRTAYRSWVGDRRMSSCSARSSSPCW